MRVVRTSRLVNFRFLPLLTALVLSVGCNDGVTLGTVQGQVTQNGNPQSKLWVRFVPVGGGRPAEDITDGEGRYELSYTGTKKGALVGKHQVTILSGGEIDGRGNELSPRKEIFRKEVDVERGSNELDFDLNSQN